MANKSQSPQAVAYARALLDLASERNEHVPFGAELQAIAQIVQQTPTFGLYLSDPAIGTAERDAFFEKVFGPSVSQLMKHVFKALNERGVAGLLPEIAPAYQEVLEQKLGKIEVDLTVAHRLSDDALADVRQKISTALQKDATVHQSVDESILGGMVLRIGDQLIDASVRSQLEVMKRQFKNARRAALA